MGVFLGFVLMLAIAGLIAYVGDALGRRIGRKRLTIFGLRPKNTAILFTVGTGMLIAGLTLGLTLLVSRSARERILYYRQTVKELTDKARGAEREADAAGVNLVATQRQLAKQTELVHSEQAQAAQAEVARRQAQNRAHSAVLEARAAERRVSALRDKLTAAQARVRVAAERVRQNQSVIGRQEAKIRTAEAELANAEEAVRNAELGLRLAEARLRVSRSGPVVFQQNEEIARQPVPAHLPADVILVALRKFVRDLDEQAAKVGAREVRIAGQAVGWHALPVGERDGTDVASYLQRLSGELAGRPSATWLRATAAINTFKSETLFYRLSQYPERVVFAKGEEIAADRCEPTRPEAELVELLRKLVQEQLRPKAAQRGMLPSLDGGVVQVPVTLWLPALRRIEAATSAVRVRIVARREIGVADPLDIEFQVIPDVRG